MELVYIESRLAKPKASFVVDKKTQLLVFQRLKSVCFPDGYIKVSEFKVMWIVWNEESWLSYVYENTYSISLLGFIAKKDIRCTHKDQSFL